MVRVEGEDAFADELAGIGERLRDPSDALREEARLLERLIADAFARDASPDGARWAPRKATTARPGSRARPRSRQEGRGGLLERTGRLRASIRVAVEGSELVMSADAPYAGFLHSGTEHMEARPFLPLTGDLEPASAGAAGRWWDGLEERLADALIGGERGR